MKEITIDRTERSGPWFEQCRRTMENYHYLHTMPDPRTSYEIYTVWVANMTAGYLIFGRPEATRCADWYGSVDDVRAGRCEATRWQVLNLSRVWISGHFQPGGFYYAPSILPGYVDRKGFFRSTLASDVLKLAVSRIGFDYLLQRPPVYLDEPYEIKWLLSYCDTRLHKGTIYKAAGFELYRTNDAGIQTWRVRLPCLTPEQDRAVRQASETSKRAQKYRAQRAQLQLEL